MLKNVLAFTAIASQLFLFSCKEYDTNENGIRYKIFADSAGANGEEDGEALIHFEIKNHQDSVIESTFKRDNPIPIQIKSTPNKNDLVDALMLLSKGDSAVIFINADSIFKGQPTVPPGVFKGRDLRFTVKVVKMATKEAALADRAVMEKEFENRRQGMQNILASDTVTIVQHLKANKINYKKSPSGVYYSIVSKGKGSKLAMNDSLKVNYVGKFLDGKQFDSGKDFPFVLGVSQVIYGWHLGIGELSRGDKAVLYIPSPLGYGEQGSGSIPPNSILVFDIEVPEK